MSTEGTKEEQLKKVLSINTPIIITIPNENSFQVQLGKKKTILIKKSILDFKPTDTNEQHIMNTINSIAAAADADADAAAAAAATNYSDRITNDNNQLVITGGKRSTSKSRKTQLRDKHGRFLPSNKRKQRTTARRMSQQNDIILNTPFM